MAERTEPLKFVVESLSLHVDDSWAAEIRWDDDDGCFVLESNGPGNFDFAPCDLEELARILRRLPRQP